MTPFPDCLPRCVLHWVLRRLDERSRTALRSTNRACRAAVADASARRLAVDIACGGPPACLPPATMLARLTAVRLYAHKERHSDWLDVAGAGELKAVAWVVWVRCLTWRVGGGLRCVCRAGFRGAALPARAHRLDAPRTLQPCLPASAPVLHRLRVLAVRARASPTGGCHCEPAHSGCVGQGGPPQRARGRCGGGGRRSTAGWALTAC